MSQSKPPESSAETKSDSDSVKTYPLKNAPLPFISITLHLSDSQLLAKLTPNNCDQPPSTEKILAQINSEGFSQLFIHENVIQDIIQKRASSTEVELVLGEMRDSKLSLSVSSDKMHAYISASPAYGGEAINDTKVTELLNSKNVDYDLVDKPTLKKILETETTKQNLNEVLIASGKKAINGKDSTFTPLFSEEDYLGPKLQIDGTVDHYDTHQYIIVQEGAPLMRRTKATSGQDGINVQGKKIPAKAGKTINFARSDGANVCEKNENILVATREGHPVLNGYGVNIDPTLQVKDVSLETGNIQFEGSLMVMGDVLPKTEIDVTGDVFIKGKAERCTIHAGNDLIINGGIIHNHQSISKETEKLVYDIQAGHDVKALFISGTAVKADNDVLIQRSVMHSDISAGNSILLGDKGGKGIIIGGKSFAQNKIEANIIGTDAYIKTILICAPIKTLQDQKQQLTHELQLRNKETAMLQQLLDKIKAKGKPDTIGQVTLDKAKKIKNTIEQLIDRISVNMEKIEFLETQIETALLGKIVVNRTLFPNSFISLNDHKFECDQIKNKTTITSDGEKLIIQ